MRTVEWARAALVAVCTLGSCVGVGARAVLPRDNASYWAQRDQLINADLSNMIGSALVLSPEEEVVNNILKEALKTEMDDAFTSLNFPPASNFVSVKPVINFSQVFNIIRAMPKGAALHTHDTALTSLEFVISNITYMDDLYICMEEVLQFRFSSSVPTLNCSAADHWQFVSDVRATYEDPADFDSFIYYSISLVTEDPAAAYTDINKVWQKFQGYFIATAGLLAYRPAFEVYLYRAMQEFQDDRVAYLEFRGTLPLLHELDGTELTAVETIQVYRDVVSQFTSTSGDDFYGTRFIYGPPRGVPVDDVWEYVSLANTLRETFPSFVAGFDLVGQEDLGRPLKDFIDPLLSISGQNNSIPVFYHAGETNWYGQSSDENLFDALLLNSSRIGHAYAISKHPLLQQTARDANIPIEVCPISNQVLMLVSDLRNHPAVGLAASNFPMVISSDDPAAWGALPLSHDFYEAFMAFGGGRADLKFLKQLAINSIQYSSLVDNEKDALMQVWQAQWDAFITDTELNNKITWTTSQSSVETPTENTN